jgi:hypothetical protein
MTAGGDEMTRESLRLETALMAQPPLWRWDIWDEARHTVVLSSWDHEWTGYFSSEEAERAGRLRLDSMIEASPADGHPFLQLS